MAIRRFRGWGVAFRVLLAALVLSGALAGGAAQADDTQAYGAREFAVQVAPRQQDQPVIGGDWVVWREYGNYGDGITDPIVRGRNLATGLSFSFPTGGTPFWPPDIDDGVLVIVEGDAVKGRYGPSGIYGYRLGDFSRFPIVPVASGEGAWRASPAKSGHTVVWTQGVVGASSTATDIYGHDLTTGRTFPICTDPAEQRWPAVAGNVVVWLDGRNAGGSALPMGDIYGYDLAEGREFRISSQTEVIGPPAISGNVVVWWAQRDRAYRVIAYDLAAQQETVLASLGYDPGNVGVDVDGSLVVWSAQEHPAGNAHVYGYDLAQKATFVVSRSIGSQSNPRIAGHTVVWTDGRHTGRYLRFAETDIYGATLTPGPAPLPKPIGVPATVDARIQIVYPNGGQPVAEADRASVGAVLLQGGTMKPAPCPWYPEVLLWKAVNDGPARIVGTAAPSDQGVPEAVLWAVSNVDVAAARDVRNRVFFFMTVTGTPSRSNIWAHAVDARTYFPRQDVPTAVAPAGAAVDAKIEILWPHNNAPVAQARLANLTAALFAPDTLVSVPPNWQPTVRLWRALDNGVSEPVAVGTKRLLTRGGLTYPVWDFNNVDVSAARDPAHKLYFTLSVDGVTAYTNVWAHGVDARTYFPYWDQFDGTCAQAN